MDKDFGKLLFLQNAAHAGLIRLPDVPVAARIVLMQRLLAAHAGDIQEGPASPRPRVVFPSPLHPSFPLRGL